MKNESNSVTIVYDGDCPFCSRYVKMVRLKEAFGSVELVDARSPHPEAREAGRLFDLNEGMAARIAGRWYHGADCMNILASASGASSTANRIFAWLFSDARRARFLYPFLRTGRNATLRLLGRKKL